MLAIPGESIEIQRVVANSMCRHTFTIVQPSRIGAPNQELATGVGVKWKGVYLILTAGHVIDRCPEQSLRFFLPTPEVQYVPTRATSKAISFELRRLMELEDPKSPIFADEADLAAIMLPPQPNADEFFFPLDETPTAAAEGTQVGVFGYPAATKIRLHNNYIASPEYFFGSLDAAGRSCTHEPMQNFTVPYELPHSAKGFSGSGLWYWPSAPVWSPNAQLTGIIAAECPTDRVVSGYDINTIVEFLNQKADLLQVL